MAWYNENTMFQWGVYKGLRVSQVDDADFIREIHHNKLNVYFTSEVLQRLGIENKGKTQKKPKRQIEL